MAPYSFKGKVALVTGGGSGIGRATCLLLARDNARVLVTDVNLEAAQETLNLMPCPEDHLALQLDVRDRDGVEVVVRAARDRYGAPPSLLVNSAGVARGAPCHLMSEEDFDHVVNINLKGTHLVSEAVTRAVLEEGGEGEGCGAIVNISSVDGKAGHANHCQYSASKGGVFSLTKTSAAQLAKEGVRVNCVLPGAIDTRMTADLTPDDRKRINSLIPMGRLGKPEEVAEVVVFLLSERSSYIVGACVEVSGGFCM